MVQVTTNLTTRESARKERFEPAGSVSSTNVQKAIEELDGDIAALSSKSVKILTGVGGFASPYAALPTDDALIVKQAAGAPFTITVDWSIRTKALRVADGKGDAQVNNITIMPSAGQTQLGTVNYSYIIDGNGGSITLTPLPDNTGAY